MLTLITHRVVFSSRCALDVSIISASPSHDVFVVKNVTLQILKYLVKLNNFSPYGVMLILSLFTVHTILCLCVWGGGGG